MSDLISIHRELQRLSKALALATNEFREAAERAANARTDYDIEWAKALLNKTDDDATQKIKEAQATLVCAQYMREARIAEAIRDALKERIRALESVLTVQQSRLRYLDIAERSEP